MKTGILTQFVDQFRRKHQRPPKEVVLSPEALLVLARRGESALVVDGVPVVAKDIREVDLTTGADASAVGVIVHVQGEHASLRGVSIR